MSAKKPVYLDYNASAPARPEVLEVLSSVQGKPFNPSSVHQFGRAGRKLIEEARAQVAALVGADPKNVIFNSGATEGNNTVLKHFEGQRVLVSSIEHPSVLEVRDDAELIPVTPEGVVDLEALEGLLRQEPKAALVSVMLVNNETGVIQPVQEVSALARKYGAYVHCDAAQAAGRIPVAINELGADFMTLSSHKIAGPQGVGALVMGLCGETPMLLSGGGQEKKARAGTENVAGIAGFGQAAELALGGLDSYQGLSVLRDELEAGVGEIVPGAIFHGRDQGRVGNTSLFSVPDVSSETLLMALDLEGICVSNGSACASGKVGKSYVLEAMGVSPEGKFGTLRISFGWGSASEDVQSFLKSFRVCMERMSVCG